MPSSQYKGEQARIRSDALVDAVDAIEADAPALPPTSFKTGVSWANYKRLWLASIWANGRNNSIGYFEDEEAAARAYDAAATAILAKPILNFLPDGSPNPDRHRKGLTNT
jgi:hypothetical protein